MNKSIPPLALAVFIFTRLLILFGYDIYMSDVEIYYQVATTGVGKGLHAYTDILYGYPPLSLLTVYLPYYFTQDYKLYRFLYEVTNVGFDYLCFLYLAKFLYLKLQVDKKRLLQALLLYSIVGLFYAHYMYDRVDMFIVFCFMASIYYCSDNKFFHAITMGVLGTLWKVIPIFWLPIIVLLYSRTKVVTKRAQRLLIGSALALVPSALILWSYDLWRKGDLFKTLSLHTDRGIQIESLLATPFMLLKTFFSSTPVYIDLNNGAHHLAGEGVTPTILFLAKYFGFTVLLLFYCFIFWRLVVHFKDDGEVIDPQATNNLRETKHKNIRSMKANEKIIQNATLTFFTMSSVILLFLLFQRVFSTTFMIWLIPIFSIFWALHPSRLILFLTLSLSILTYIGFDIGYFEYRNFNVFYNIIYLLRNSFLVVYAYLFFKKFLEKKSNEFKNFP